MNDALVTMLIDVADALDRALAVPQSPYQTAMRAAMAQPRTGDLVVVTFARGEVNRFGRYLGTTIVTIEEASDVNGWEAITDDAFVIVTPDGREVTWTNSRAMRVSDLETAARVLLDAARETITARTEAM